MASAYELTANNYATTLSGAAGSGDATISVASTTGAPSATLGNWRVLVDSELMLVTSVSGTTLTVTRGIEGTVAASHSSGAAVTHVLTAASLIQVLRDQSPFGRFTLPPIATGGPTTTQFGWINQNSGTVDATYNAVALGLPANSADSITMLVKTIPATSYVVTAYLDSTLISNTAESMLILRKSSDGTFIGFGQYVSGNVLNLFVGHGTSAGPAITVVDSSVISTQMYKWFKVADDGANRTYHVSIDGLHWTQFYTQAHATPLVPDQIGFGGEARNASYGLNINLWSWLEA